MVRTAFLATIVLSTTACSWFQRESAPDVEIVVFRHHPGMIDTAKRMTDRDLDEKTILTSVEKKGIGFSYEGGLGRGYELSLRSSDLEKWKAEIDRLIAGRILTYYDRWELDEHGYGLVPIR